MHMCEFIIKILILFEAVVRRELTPGSLLVRGTGVEEKETPTVVSSVLIGDRLLFTPQEAFPRLRQIRVNQYQQ